MAIFQNYQCLIAGVKWGFKMSKKRHAKRRAKAKARRGDGRNLPAPYSRRSRVAEIRAAHARNRAALHNALDAAAFSSEEKATLRACPELTVFGWDIPAVGVLRIGLEDVLDRAALERYYDRLPDPEDC